MIQGQKFICSILGFATCYAGVHHNLLGTIAGLTLSFAFIVWDTEVFDA